MNTLFKKKKKTRYLLLFLLGIAPAAGLGIFLFFRIGTWLAVSDPVPPRLDLIFTFAGENQRVAYSRNLTRQFPEAHWVLSDYYHLYSRILQRDGFTMSRLSLLDTCPNTLSEANGLKDWISSHENTLIKHRTPGDTTVVLTVGLVSNPFHMRRIRFMVQSVFHDASIRFYYLPVPQVHYRWTSRNIAFWWQLKTTRNWVSSETGKLLAFWFFS